MAVDTEHATITARKDDIARVRAALDGKIDDQILQMPGHDSDDYDRFVKRAYWLPATQRTHEAYVGMVMSPEPSVQGVPRGMEHLQEDVTSTGEPIERLAATIVKEVLATGRCAVLVDYPETGGEEAITVARSEAMGLRPYATYYSYDNVVNWRTGTVSGRTVLTQIRLREVFEVETGDFETDVIERIRVLDLDSGIYRARVYERHADSRGKLNWQIVSTAYPRKNGQYLSEIPCFVFGVSSLDINQAVQAEPPMLPLSNVNIAHLNNSASLEWALLWVGSPTLFLAGRVPTDGQGQPLPIRLGSSSALVMEENSKAEILQASAESLGALRQAMEDKRRDMVSIGSRVLQESGTGQISTETDASQQAGERSTLAQIAGTVSDGLTKVLSLMIDWAGQPNNEVSVALNTDYAPKDLTPQELTAWTNAVQQGALPQSMFLALLKKRGAAAQELTLDEFEDEIEEGGMGQDDTTDFDQTEPPEDVTS